MHPFLNFIEDLLFPQRCFACGRDGSGLCAQCRHTLRHAPLCCPFCGIPSILGETCMTCKRTRILRAARSVYAYEDNKVERLLHLIKYAGRFSLLTCVQENIAETLSECAYMPDTVLIPIPQSPVRYRERGYNQSELLAKLCSTQTGIPWKNYLVTQESRVQHTKSREERLTGLDTYFRVTKLAKTTKHAIVIDDILTTGGTCEAAARTLYKAGVPTVTAFTLARQEKLFQ